MGQKGGVDGARSCPISGSIRTNTSFPRNKMSHSQSFNRLTTSDEVGKELQTSIRDKNGALAIAIPLP